MQKKTIYEIKAIYRDDLRVIGYKFGKGKKSVCIVGSMRGNEIQQLYTCSQLVKRMKKLEEQGKIHKGHSIMIIPSVNPYSMNIKKRFWPTDNTDINRMFPGYDLGETTQRIAAGVFEAIKDYTYGIQFASFYMPGNFTPHVRMMKSGFEDVEMAKEFGMPYIVLRKVRPYDTTTLNYNWQLWETKAFSLYTTSTNQIDKDSAKEAIAGILRFLAKEDVIDYEGHNGYQSMVVNDKDMISVRAKKSGLFEAKVSVGQEIEKGQTLAKIIDPYEGCARDVIVSPVDGFVFFAHNEPLTYANTAVFKLIARTD